MLLRFDDNGNGLIDYQEFLGSEDLPETFFFLRCFFLRWELASMICSKNIYLDNYTCACIHRYICRYVFTCVCVCVCSRLIIGYWIHK